MKRQATFTFFFKYLKEFILDHRSRWIYSISFILLLLVYFIHFKKEDLLIFPFGENMQFVFYTDSIDNGNSIIEEDLSSDSLLSMSFILREGFVRPYVGLTLFKESYQDLDISIYNQIKVEAEGSDIKDIALYLITRNEDMAIILNRYEDLYYVNNLELTARKQRYILNLNSFKIPDWWYDVNNLSHNTALRPNWKQLIQINIATGLIPSLDIEHNLKIYSISFVRNNTRIIILFGLIQLGIMLFLLVIYLSRVGLLKGSKHITINYKAITLYEKPDLHYPFLTYIHENFHDSNLSLEIVSKYTGVSKRNIADSISEQFGCNFKTYINQIRISEAQRLLKESDLNNSEIAYKVGFSSPSNFNRVFKNLSGKNPSEYLQTKE